MFHFTVIMYYVTVDNKKIKHSITILFQPSDFANTKVNSSNQLLVLVSSFGSQIELRVTPDQSPLKIDTTEKNTKPVPSTTKYEP